MLNDSAREWGVVIIRGLSGGEKRVALHSLYGLRSKDTGETPAETHKRDSHSTTHVLIKQE